MRKDQFDRQPDERSAEQGTGKRDHNRPEAERRAPDLPGKDKAQRGRGEHPAGHPIDKTAPTSDARFGRRESYEEDERSDRTSGRPVQLEHEKETPRPGQADGELGLGGPQEGGRQDRRLAEDQPTRR